MTAPNWQRTYERLQRNIAELRALDCQVIEPPNFELPPGRRYAQGGPVGDPRPFQLEPGEDLVSITPPVL